MMTRDEAQEAIIAIMKVHPDLGASGFGPISNEDRVKMMLDEYADEFLAALSFIDECKRMSASARATSSYSLKHSAERIKGTYIANGMMIAAAAYRGINVTSRIGPNVMLPLRHPVIEAEERRMRRTGR